MMHCHLEIKVLAKNRFRLIYCLPTEKYLVTIRATFDVQNALLLFKAFPANFIFSQTFKPKHSQKQQSIFYPFPYI